MNSAASSKMAASSWAVSSRTASAVSSRRSSRRHRTTSASATSSLAHADCVRAINELFRTTHARSVRAELRNCKKMTDHPQFAAERPPGRGGASST